ncbi:hypothetical protein GCM10027168_43200 [Streptomyces capparidis]
MSATPPASHRSPTSRHVLLVVALVPAVVVFALWAFAWPAARLAPRDLPVGVAGPAPAAAALERPLAARGDAFDIHRYGDEAAAREAIEEREVYGALVATPRGVKLLTASAASPAVAELLTGTAAAQAPPGHAPVVEDVVPAPEADPRGSGLSAGVLPLSLAGVAAGALPLALGLGRRATVAALAGAAALTGPAAAAIAGSWLGVVEGDRWANAGVYALAVFCVGAVVAGCAALLGPRGLGVGPAVVVLCGNPWAGVGSAPHLLPEPVGAIGQWLPPGASGTMLRGVAWFDGHGIGTAALALTLWTALGLAAVALSRRTGPPARTAAVPPAVRETQYVG